MALIFTYQTVDKVARSKLGLIRFRTMSLRLATSVWALLATVALVGCDAPGLTSKAARAPEHAAEPPVGTTTIMAAASAATAPPPATPPRPQSPAIVSPSLNISDLIAQVCGLSSHVGELKTSFEYDSAALSELDRQLLGDIARCLTEGALRGQNILLVGRADARGESEYNMTLGESRADAVHRYLVDLGVGKDRMRSTSRGKMDATGVNEEGWARDRRVDIELAL